MMSFETKVMLSFSLLMILFTAVVSQTGVLANYSSGDRVGVVDKISEKGIFNKSYEGELKMQGVSTNQQGQLVQNVFLFSIRDPKVATQLVEASKLGKPVQLHYRQWLMKPSAYQDTKYTVLSVK
jgi:hypothetical protein